MKYHDEITVAFLTAFLVFAAVAIARLTQIETDTGLTREAMQQLRDDARTYNEWVQKVTTPAALCK